MFARSKKQIKSSFFRFFFTKPQKACFSKINSLRQICKLIWASIYASKKAITVWPVGTRARDHNCDFGGSKMSFCILNRRRGRSLELTKYWKKREIFEPARCNLKCATHLISTFFESKMPNRAPYRSEFEILARSRFLIQSTEVTVARHVRFKNAFLLKKLKFCKIIRRNWINKLQIQSRFFTIQLRFFNIELECDTKIVRAFSRTRSCQK